MLALTQGMMSLAAGGGDPHFANVVSLLHFDGADGSTVIFDQTGRSWSRTGNARLSTLQSRFGGSSLILEPGVSIETAASADFAFGTGDFTVELFARRRVTGTTNFDWLVFGPNWDIYSTPSNELLLWDGSVNAITSAGGMSPAGVWTHIAVTRAGSTVRLFRDGVLLGSATRTTNFTATHPVSVGFYPPNLRRTDGNVDDLRITRGVARYTSTFTPPTAPFPDS